MIAAIHLEWKKLRPDLRHDAGALRDERLSFITDALNLKRPLTSVRHLSDRQLGLALDAMRRLKSQPRLPDHSFCEAVAAPEREVESGAKIIHLASAEQVHTIHKLLDHLGWSLVAREKFIKDRFRRTGPAMLSPQQAHSLIRILLNIAAARAIRERGFSGARLSRAKIGAEIPAIKALLGIDRKDMAVTAQEVDS
jgi:hypothetical protein